MFELLGGLQISKIMAPASLPVQCQSSQSKGCNACRQKSAIGNAV